MSPVKIESSGNILQELLSKSYIHIPICFGKASHHPEGLTSKHGLVCLFYVAVIGWD